MEGLECWPEDSVLCPINKQRVKNFEQRNNTLIAVPSKELILQVT